jgi:hypothetical protein
MIFSPYYFFFSMLISTCFSTPHAVGGTKFHITLPLKLNSIIHCLCRTTGVTQPVLDYLLWHHLGADYTERAHDLVNIYKHYFEKDVKVVRDLFFVSESSV